MNYSNNVFYICVCGRTRQIRGTSVRRLVRVFDNLSVHRLQASLFRNGRICLLFRRIAHWAIPVSTVVSEHDPLTSYASEPHLYWICLFLRRCKGRYS